MDMKRVIVVVLEMVFPEGKADVVLMLLHMFSHIQDSIDIQERVQPVLRKPWYETYYMCKNKTHLQSVL